MSEDILQFTAKMVDGHWHYGCRGIGDQYDDFYNKFIPKTSYKCIREDFPWDYFIFSEILHEQQFLKQYSSKITYMDRTISLTNDVPIEFTLEHKMEDLQTFFRDIKSTDGTFFNNPQPGVVFHRGYLNYLSKAWANHYSVVIRPTDIWYIILNELVFAIKKNPSKYEKLFTKNPGLKELIVVPTLSVEEINPELVINILKNRVPVDVDTFLPTFSTDTPFSKLAMNVSFCDMVSPYYSYCTFMCGIPKIRVDGTYDDWNNIVEHLTKLISIFGMDFFQYFVRCRITVEKIIEAVQTHDVEFFKKMVMLEECGSGHQFEMNGWIIYFLNNENCNNPIQLEGLPSHITYMDYTNMETERKFRLYCGLFYSNIVDGFLIPEYDAMRLETTAQSN